MYRTRGFRAVAREYDQESYKHAVMLSCDGYVYPFSKYRIAYIFYRGIVALLHLPRRVYRDSPST